MQGCDAEAKTHIKVRFIIDSVFKIGERNGMNLASMYVFIIVLC